MDQNKNKNSAKWQPLPHLSYSDPVSSDRFENVNNNGFSTSTANLFISQQQKIYKLESQVESQSGQIKEFSKAIAQYSDDVASNSADLIMKIESSEEEIASLKRGVAETRNKTLEPLAIFVGLFTFASISFQIFANVRDFEIWTALLVVIAGVLTIFSGLVIHATSISLDIDKRRKVTAWIIAMGLLLTVGGSILYTIGNQSIRMKYASDCVELKAEERVEAQIYCKMP